MDSVKVGALERSYQIVRPAHPDGPSLPAIVVLHGSSVGIDIEEQRDGLLPLATSGRAVLVYPVGYDQSWNAGTCCGSAQLDQVDDVAFLTIVVHRVAAMQGVDPRAVALVGFSNGGRMAYQLVCEKPGLVSSVAVVAAIPDDTCPPGRPVTLLQVAGSADPQINAIQLGAHVASWRARDGCTATVTTRTVGQLTLRRWTHCRRGTGIELATYSSDAHTWPEGSRGTPPTAQVIWEFLTVPRQPG
jgi:polyhydroxybutyrate depolymerase